MDRRNSTQVRIGGVAVGGGAPVAVQSMTDTDTANAEATLAQIKALAAAGSELVRVTVNNAAAARAVPGIRQRMDDAGLAGVPLIGDFHFIGHRLLAEVPECARALDKFRINPGNIGRGQTRDANFTKFVEIARDLDKPIRIGVNAGSLDGEMLAAKMDANARANPPLSAEEVENQALVESALASAEQAQEIGLPESRIVVSCKVSRLSQVVAVNREIAERSNYALHIGLTEAGMGRKGTISSTAALAVLLHEGIGDTIRVSLTPAVGADRAEEVRICQDVLQALGIRSFKPQITACPGCGRTESDFFRRLAQTIEAEIEVRRGQWREDYPGSEELKVAVMGCVVNGPGESRSADIGISLPGTGEAPTAPVFVDGKRHGNLKGEDIPQQFMRLIEEYVRSRWQRAGA